jgi:protocatechuate 4,5-dioxygenase beta chain
VSHALAGDAELSWHIINGLVADEFDITMCQDMLVDHAITIPMALMWPGGKPPPVKIVPVSINTVQHPLPSVKRCLELGRSVGRAVRSYQKDLRVLMVGTSGLSHQFDGERAASSTRSSTSSAWTASSRIRMRFRPIRSRIW